MLNKLLHNRTRSAQPKAPFFILGCVRSGTTMLRDLLRLHPKLECPEETHFFRWSDPFKTPRYIHPYQQNPHIKQQRNLDHISAEEFEEVLAASVSRGDLNERYARLYLEKQGNRKSRWFDKSPQNIYGILLLSRQFPDAQFIHIYRNPLNVVTSLFEGKVMSVNDLYGATNYWLEAMQIIDGYKQIAGSRLLEVGYENVATNPQHEVDQILDFIGEHHLAKIPKTATHPERNRYKGMLGQEQINEIVKLCQPYFDDYGFGA